MLLRMRPSRSALVALVLMASPVLAQAPQQQLSATRDSLKQRQADEARLKKELGATNDALDAMRARATTLAASLQKSERSASKAEANLEDVSSMLSAKEREFGTRKKEYAQTVASLLRMQKLPPSAMFAKPGQLHEVMTTSQVMQSTTEALAARATALRKDMARLTALRKEVASGKADVTRQRAMLAEQQKQLAADLATRQRLQKQLQQNYGAAQSEVAKLSRQSVSLQDLIGKLEKSRASGQLARSTQSNPPPVNAGSMQPPVSGMVKHRFGERKNSNEAYRGMVLSARSGATVVAPSSGEVVFTGPFRDYGQMVLIKHGSGYISLLAGLGNIAVSLNQQVSRGEPLGSMGTSSPELYVELRQRSKPVDPTRWFANLR
jgi:septal ring factor EnvC (AmiA/AmiB activator)